MFALSSRYLLIAILAATAAWWVRGTIAHNDLLEYQQDQAAAMAEYRRQVQEVEAAEARNRQTSTERLDKVERQIAVDVQYVDREVIRYVTKYKTTECPDPQRAADWVHLYNRTLGLP